MDTLIERRYVGKWHALDRSRLLRRDRQEQIAAVHAGSVRAYLAGKTLAVVACGLALDLVALVWPVAAGSFDAPMRNCRCWAALRRCC